MMFRICAALLLAWSFVCSPALAQAPPGPSTVSGRILETSAGLPVVGAKVELRQGNRIIASTTTTADGTFSLANVPHGDYSVLVSASGYQSALIQSLPVLAGQSSAFQTALNHVTAGLKEIAVVSTSSHAALQTSATINNSISPSLLQDQNYIRAGDALGTLPFVTAGTSSSLGDDETLSIRGFDPTETATLLDGHPIGPIGAQGQGFDYQLAQFWGYSDINVIYGSGATGLYGVPTIAGAVNFETLNPTPTDHFTVTQGYGDLGKAMTGLSATGTAGRLGYALAYGVQGTDGELGPEPITQWGLLGSGADNCGPGNANTSAGEPTLRQSDVAYCSYQVSGEYLNRNVLGKLTYQFDSKTSLLLAAYNASMWADSSGNGDTDYLTYPFQLANAPVGNDFTYGSVTTNCGSSKVAVLNDSSQGYTCLTAQQYANQFTGPAGGGIGRFHSAGNQDYHARFSRKIGSGTLILDGFVDNYGYVNVKGPAPAPAHDDIYLTHGGLISYDLSSSKNDVSAGVYFQHQLHETNEAVLGGPFTGFTLGNTTYYVSDTYTPTDRLSVFADLGLDHSVNTTTTSFDPRVSVVYRPTSSDVLRITGGRSTSEPDPSLLLGGFQFSQYSQSFNAFASCNQLASIGSGQSPDLQPEHANDIEFAAAHRFPNQATLELDAYDEIETNPILGGTFPLSIVPAAQQPGAAITAPYIQALDLTCGKPNGYSVANLGVSSSFNAGQGVYRGINLNAKLPITRALEIDGGYTVQSAYYTGLNDEILSNNIYYINGGQFSGVPLHQANAGIGYNNRAGEFTARIDSYYVGAPNPFSRPAYWYANGNVSKTVGPITFNLGVANIFNNAASPWGLVGLGTYTPENQFGDGATTGLEQGSEEFGLPARQIWMTTTIRL